MSNPNQRRPPQQPSSPYHYYSPNMNVYPQPHQHYQSAHISPPMYVVTPPTPSYPSYYSSPHGQPQPIAQPVYVSPTFSSPYSAQYSPQYHMSPASHSMSPHQSDLPPTPVCKQFARDGACQRGAACRYLHIGSSPSQHSYSPSQHHVQQHHVPAHHVPQGPHHQHAPNMHGHPQEQRIVLANDVTTAFDFMSVSAQPTTQSVQHLQQPYHRLPLPRSASQCSSSSNDSSDSRGRKSGPSSPQQSGVYDKNATTGMSTGDRIKKQPPRTNSVMDQKLRPFIEASGPWTAESMSGHVALLACDIRTTRPLQEMISTLRADTLSDEQQKVKAIILDEVVRSFVQLAIDPCGNYVCQQVIDLSTTPAWRVDAWKQCNTPVQVPSEVFLAEPNRISPANSISSNDTPPDAFKSVPNSDLVEVSLGILVLHSFASRVLQKLISRVCSDVELDFLYEHLSAHLPSTMLNTNGTRIAQECLVSFCAAPSIPSMSVVDTNTSSSVMSPEVRTRAHAFVYYAIRAHCRQIACHQLGCLVMKRCIDACPSGDTKAVLLSEIVSEALALMQDQFGNYVIQHVLVDPALSADHIAALIQTILPHLFELCTQKFSSNVVEKILGLPAAPGSVSLLSAFSSFSDAQLCALLEDKFGNYVLQRASSLKQPNRTLLLVRLAPLVDRMRAEPATQLRQKIVAQFTQLFKNE